MVRGLELFREHFREYADRYVLIGGTACVLAMEQAGVEFRATKDLDIVLCVEALDREFVAAFWSFVRSGGYQVQEKSTGRKQFYRFQKPRDERFPFMLELFARLPDALRIAEGSHLTPLPMEEQISSLSAILMDAGYYAFILSGRRESDGIPFIGAEHLIPLKARAWLDLTERQNGGEAIDSKVIRKHKNDVFRLYQIVDPTSDPAPPESVKGDLRLFIARMAAEDIDLGTLGLRGVSRDDVLTSLNRLYRLG